VDNYFEPAMQTDNILTRLVGDIFGSDPGAGMAMAISLVSACGLAISLAGYAFPVLHEIED
ncbi:MAG: MFS transporter, partial [Cyanobacteria bacterium P01_A01_bin.83]